MEIVYPSPSSRGAGGRYAHAVISMQRGQKNQWPLWALILSQLLHFGKSMWGCLSLGEAGTVKSNRAIVRGIVLSLERPGVSRGETQTCVAKCSNSSLCSPTALLGPTSGNILVCPDLPGVLPISPLPCACLSSLQKPSQWPLEISARTLLFLIAWPFIVQWLLRRFQRRKR